MEIYQESSSPKPSTKSSRKRQRKKITAALKKLEASVNSVNTVSCEGHEVRIASKVQSEDSKSETKKEYLSTITFPTLLQKTDTSQSKVNVQDALKPIKSKIISCVGAENVSSEKSEGSTSNPDKELSASQSKRKRNRKRNIVNTVSCEGHEVSIVSKSQETVDIPKCLAHNSTSQKDCISKLNKLASLTPLNIGDLKNSVLDKNTLSVPTSVTAKTDEITDSKPKEGDSIGKEQSLPPTKRRRNRKKENIPEVANSTPCGNTKSKKVQELPDNIPKPSSKLVPPQEEKSPKKEDSILEYSTSRIALDNEVIGKSLPHDRSDLTTKPVAVTVISAKKILESGSGKSSVDIEKSEPKDKRTVEVSNQKCDLDVVKKKSVAHNKEKACKGESGEKYKKVLNCKLGMNSEPRSDTHQSEKLKEKSEDLVDVINSSRETELEFRREQNQSFFIFEQTGIYCSHTTHSAEDLSCCPAAVAGAALEKVDSVKENPANKMNKDQGKKTKQPSSHAPPVPEKKSEIKSDKLESVVMAMDKVKIHDNKGGPKTDAQNVNESHEDEKEKIKAEREARKAAKLAKKKKVPGEAKETGEKTVGQVPQVPKINKASVGDKTDEVVAPKSDTGPAKPEVPPSKEGESGGKSKAELRAERRAKQDAQRAAKASQSSAAPSQAKVKSVEEKSSKIGVQESKNKEPNKCLVNKKVVRKEQGDKLLSRLGWDDGRVKRSTGESATLRDTQAIHPAIVQLSTRFTNRIISGSNARCLAFVQAIKKAIQDYQTPSQKELGRDLDSRLLAPSLAYLEAQRPHAVSVSNATKFLKWQLTQLQPVQPCSPDSTAAPYSETRKSSIITDEEAKKSLIDGLDAYVWEKIKVAEEAVCETLKDKIRDGDVILTYGCSYLLQQILMGAKKGGTKFKVIVVDGRPWREGREMLRCLVAVGIPCSYVLLSAASTVMRQVNKVLLGAHALLSNGYVMSRVGVSQVALLASAHNVPVLVACETHKFCERVQSDSFVYNEMGEPDGLAQLLGGEDGPLSGWRNIPNLSLLNLSYDVTPPELVTAVATELAVLPCTSVPVVLRVRPTEPIASRH